MASSLLTDLVSYWKLDEGTSTRVDSHDGHDLSPVGVVGGTPGKIGTAASFTAASNHALSGAPHADFQTFNKSFAVAGWVKFTNLTPTRYRLAGKSDGQNFDEWQLWWSANQFLFFVRDTFDFGYAVAAFDKSALAGTWYWLYAAVDSGNRTCYLSVDNAPPSGSTNGHILGDDTNSPLWLGRGGSDLVADDLNGALDEWGYWKRTLTEKERGWLWNSGSGLTYPFAGTFDSAASGCTLFVAGPTGPSSGCTLFTHGRDASSSGMTLFVSGPATNPSGCTLSTWGHQPASSGSTLFILAAPHAVSKGMSLWVGADPTGADSGGATLFTFGSNQSGWFGGTTLHTFSDASGNVQNRSMPLFVKGPSQDADRRGMSLWVGGGAHQGYGGIPLYVQPPSGATLGAPLYVGGLGVTEGAVPTGVSLNLFIRRGAADAVTLYVAAPGTSAASGATLFVKGASPSGGGTTLAMNKVVGFQTGPARLYTHGF